MATRMRMLNLLHEFRGFNDQATRRPFARTPGLFALALRPPARIAPPKRKRVISIAMQDPLDFPAPVKITWLSPGK